MTSSQLLILLTIIVYLGITIVIGIIFNHRGGASSASEFYIGGRGLGPIVTAMSAEASDMSSYLLMGLPGLAYLAGLAEVTWTAVGLAVGTYLNFLFVARYLRRYSAKLGAITIPEYFSRRYGDDRQVLSMIAALIILIFFVPYTASGFKAVGTLFNSLLGINYHAAMIAGAVVIVLYTALGGFKAVSTTDLIQSIIMSAALVIIIFYGIHIAGGFDVVAANARELPGYLNIFEGHDAASGTAGSFGALPVVSTLAWGLGYFGMPHILLRFMAVKDEAMLKTSRRIASVWAAVSMAVAILIGVIGLAISRSGVLPFLGTSSESETIIIQMANLMSRSNAFMAVIAGIILAGILAATMSTADSQLLAASSSMSQDLLQGFFGIKLDHRKTMLAARGTVILIAVIGVILAWNPESSVFRVVSFAWAGFGATFGPTMLLSLFWKRSNRQGALAGMVAGGITVFVWKFLIAPLGGVFSIYELLPAFIVCLAVNVIVTLLTPAPDSAVEKLFDEVHTR